MNILTLPVPAAVAGAVSQVLQFRDGPPRNLTLQGNLAYGSGGTSADAWVQTSLDGGASWVDIANFHFLLASARKAFNLSSRTPVTTQATPTDGTLAANTAVDGLLGNLIRVKYTIVGTYAGSTLSVDCQAQTRLVPQP